MVFLKVFCKPLEYEDNINNNYFHTLKHYFCPVIFFQLKFNLLTRKVKDNKASKIKH